MTGCGGGMPLQHWGCTSPGREMALFFGYGASNVCCRSWLNGDRRWPAAVGLDERKTARTKRRTKGGGESVRLGGGLRCTALQLENRITVADPGKIYGSELQGFAQKVAACNAGSERKAEFLPLVVEKFTLGYVHNRFAQHLKRFPEVFEFEGMAVNAEAFSGSFAAGSISLTRSFSSSEQRTAAVQAVLEALRSEGLIPGWRDELLPITPIYGASPLLLMERAAFPLFGVKGYGIHMNGYVNIDGEKYLWVAKRSDSKQTFPGMLDHIVAGGQPHGISAKDNVIKECDEEAGIPSHLAEKAVAAGAVSYEVIGGETLKRDVLFCYDLELPLDFEPYNKDGEVQSFYKLPVSEVYDIISKSDHYKPNCALVSLTASNMANTRATTSDPIRYITPEQKGYMSLLESLRTGEL